MKTKKYKSNLEKNLHSGPLSKTEYEPTWAKVKYEIHKTYNPDFVDPEHKDILYEAKGRARTAEEMTKFLWIKSQRPDLTIRFIIMNPNVRAYPQTKMKLGAWLDRHNFEWCLHTDIPQEWNLG